MTITDWHDHLSRLALPTGEVASTLTGPLPEDGFCDLGAQALLTVTGAEAESFLQGQLTCDVHQLASGDVLPAAHLTPKGRALASFLAWEADGSFYLQFPQALAEAVTRRLRMFLMRSKATINHVNDTLVLLGAWGSAAEAVATRLVGRLPDTPFRQVTADGVTVLRLPGETPRFELVLPIDSAIETWRTLEAADAKACNEAAWRLLDIRSGLGWIHAETTETFIPQMLNYDRIGGISFTKGCYVGQEVVARLHHLGKVKRRAYLGTLILAEAPPPGTPLFSPESSSRQGAGTVVDAVVTASGECELLAVVERKAQAAGDLRLETPDGPVVKLREPPYALADPERIQAPA